MVRSLSDDGLEAGGFFIGLRPSWPVVRATAGLVYPGWTPRPESPLLALASQVYQRARQRKGEG